MRGESGYRSSSIARLSSFASASVSSWVRSRIMTADECVSPSRPARVLATGELRLTLILSQGGERHMSKADVPAVERTITQTINETARSDPDECRMEQLYRSPNNDTWFLARNPTTGLTFIRHQAITPSGGRVAAIEIGPFR